MTNHGICLLFMVSCQHFLVKVDLCRFLFPKESVEEELVHSFWSIPRCIFFSDMILRPTMSKTLVQERFNMLCFQVIFLRETRRNRKVTAEFHPTLLNESHCQKLPKAEWSNEAIRASSHQTRQLMLWIKSNKKIAF